MEEEKENQIMFFLSKSLKKKFKKKCIDNDTDMSTVLRNFIRRYTDATFKQLLEKEGK